MVEVVGKQLTSGYYKFHSTDIKGKCYSVLYKRIPMSYNKSGLEDGIQAGLKMQFKFHCHIQLLCCDLLFFPLLF